MAYDTEVLLSTELHNINEHRPYTPDFARIESRGQQLKRRRSAMRAGAGAGIIAAVTVTALTLGGSGDPGPSAILAVPSPTASTGPAAVQSPLLRLVGALSTTEKAAGDATLTLRDQKGRHGERVKIWDLQADSGEYYFAQSRGALPAQVRGKHNQLEEADAKGRKNALAAATFAAEGDLDEARKRMALAFAPDDPLVEPTLEPPGLIPSVSAKLPKEVRDRLSVNVTDNWVWHNSLDALTLGSSDPAVRAGVLRLLDQMPEVKVAEGTLSGDAVLTLTGATPATLGETEILTVSAGTGTPIRLTNVGISDTRYTVTRVQLADVAKGKF
ncbi:hypothetical protein GCM10010435_83570 [Winogradskya consettensis]|uniref:Uncharacterized protein n=1 Tax=Winogradskya consettensis TaxID=113560 RepID=A0A919T297_9ACTN|nr:hypothetical protein [Actinoplanes consettensis]GIM82228.1 hypothetical protein Aco04nite_80530 [Actinoplanes consettensis]